MEGKQGVAGGNLKMGEQIRTSKVFLRKQVIKIAQQTDGHNSENWNQFEQIATFGD